MSATVAADRVQDSSADVLRSTDIRWAHTLPRLVRPRPEADESLAGVLLRADARNRWKAGTTARLAGFDVHQRAPMPPRRLIVPTTSMYEHIAALFNISVDEVMRLTYEQELLGLYSQTSLMYRLGPLPPFRVCPGCLAADLLVRRSTFLEQLSACPEHRLLFVATCGCGEPLRLWDLDEKPARCGGCGQPWIELKSSPPAAEAVIAEGERQRLYSALLADPTPTMRALGEELVGVALNRNKSPRPVAKVHGRTMDHHTEDPPLSALVRDLHRLRVRAERLQQTPIASLPAYRGLAALDAMGWQEVAFWSQVQVEDGDGCWDWLGYRRTRRDRGNTVVGLYNIARRGWPVFSRPVASFVYEAYVGPIPVGQRVEQACGNPMCVRPQHLQLRRHFDPVPKDRLARGERHGMYGRSEDCHFRKLTADDAVAIRERFATGNITPGELAEIYGIHRVNICQILKGVHWKLAPGPRAYPPYPREPRRKTTGGRQPCGELEPLVRGAADAP